MTSYCAIGAPAVLSAAIVVRPARRRRRTGWSALAGCTSATFGSAAKTLAAPAESWMHAPGAGIDGDHVLHRHPDDIGCPGLRRASAQAGAARRLGTRSGHANGCVNSDGQRGRREQVLHQKWISLLSEGPWNSRTVVPSVPRAPPRSAEDTSPPQVTPLPAVAPWPRYPLSGGRVPGRLRERQRPRARGGRALRRP